MRIPSIVVAVVVAVAHAAPAAQHVVPAELLSKRTIIVTGSLDFETLRHAASEFRKQGRFELTNQEGAADLMAYFSPKVDERDMTLRLPVPFGRGTIMVEEDASKTTFVLEVIDVASETVLWRDERSVTWFKRGAVIDLVKDLHEAMLDAPAPQVAALPTPAAPPPPPLGPPVNTTRQDRSFSDTILDAILNTDGPWRDAAIAATSPATPRGLSVVVTGEGGEPTCGTPEALLAAEAESILRDSGMSVRSCCPLTGVELAIRVVSLAASGQRCVSTLYMSLSLDRYQESSDPAGRDYFGSIVVTDGLVVLTHPAVSHRDVLRRRVNEYVTVWSNELVRNRP